jgi:mannose-6-phosphate isomerase-like protein (cupin superfamily)
VASGFARRAAWKGRLTIQVRDRNVELGAGELVVVPREL